MGVSDPASRESGSPQAKSRLAAGLSSGSAKRIADASKPVKQRVGRLSVERKKIDCADECRSRLSCSLSSVEDERRSLSLDNAFSTACRRERIEMTVRSEYHRKCVQIREGTSDKQPTEHTYTHTYPRGIFREGATRRFRVC